MKVCFISKNIYKLINGKGTKFAGGAEIQLLQLAKKFAERNVEVSFITETPDLRQEKVLVEGLRGIEIYSTPFRYMGGGWKYFLSDYVRLLRVVQSVDADFYIIKNPKFNLFFLSLFCKLKRKKSVFISSIDSDSDPAKLIKAEPLSAIILYLIGLSLTDIVISQADYQKEAFHRYFLKKTHTIQNIFIPGSNGQKGIIENHILWAGNNAPGKHPEIILEIATRLRNLRFKMMVIPTEKQRDEELLAAINKLANVEFLGFIPFEEVSKYYAAATLLAHTADTEGFPNSFLFAWACGTPVVSLNINPDEVISKHGLGFCASGHLNLMLEKIQHLMNNPDLVKKMGDNGRHYVAEFHHPEKIINQFLDLFSRFQK